MYVQRILEHLLTVQMLVQQPTMVSKRRYPGWRRSQKRCKRTHFKTETPTSTTYKMMHLSTIIVRSEMRVTSSSASMNSAFDFASAFGIGHEASPSRHPSITSSSSSSMAAWYLVSTSACPFGITMFKYCSSLPLGHHICLWWLQCVHILLRIIRMAPAFLIDVVIHHLSMEGWRLDL